MPEILLNLKDGSPPLSIYQKNNQDLTTSKPLAWVAQKSPGYFFENCNPFSFYNVYR